MKPIFLLDPGLISLRGHHLDLDLRLMRELQARGHEVTLYCGASLSPDLQDRLKRVAVNYKPVFRIPSYTILSEQQRTRAFYRLIVNENLKDLSMIPDDGVWVWPTLVPHHFWAAALEPRRPRQLGGIWYHPRYNSQLGAYAWSQAVKLTVRGGLPITLGAFNQELCEIYPTFGPGLRIELLPLPHDGAINDRPISVLRRIGFFGSQRAERGISLLNGLLPKLMQMGYEVTVQDSTATIRQDNSNPALTVLGVVDDFAAELLRCDLIVWPSRWQDYQMRCSGVVSEAIASGVPVVVPSGCTPGMLVERWNCGTFFHDFTVNAVVEAVQEADSDFPALGLRARAASKAWPEVNGTPRLAAWISGHAGQAARSYCA